MQRWLIWSITFFALLTYPTLGVTLQEKMGKKEDSRRVERMSTTIAVNRKATTIGASVITHNNDCIQCDQRVTHVPAKDWPLGSMRPIFPLRVSYPRYLELPEYNIHGPEYLKADVDIANWNYSDFKPIGYISQVRHTYGYTLGSYGIMNEKQLSIGQSTCQAKLYAFAVGQNSPLTGEPGKALLNIIPLTEIALERCESARCAIETIGALAEQHGFYGDITFPFSENLAKSSAGEALTIGDKEEVWMFHILPDDTGNSAVWVAQRIQEGHISVCANQFVINEIDFNDDHNFLYSKNVVDVAIRNGFYDPSTAIPFSFSAAFAIGYGVRGYESWRRVWRIFTLASPSIYLSPYTNEFGTFGYGKESMLPYPFSVKVDELLSLESIKTMARDNFEGTPFSMFDGPAAGPMGDPIRYQPFSILTSGEVEGVSYSSWKKNGKLFNKPISSWRTSYSHISLSRPNMLDTLGAVSWIAQYAPHHSVFIPVYAAAATTPPSMYVGTLYKVDRGSNWWAFCLLSNYLSRWFKWTIRTIRAYQHKLETMLETKTASIEGDIAGMLARTPCNESNDRECFENVYSLLEEFQTMQASLVLDLTWEFFWNMTGTYRDQLWIVNPHVSDFLYAYDYIEVERWVFELMGYWGAPGMPPPDATVPTKYYPINIPTLQFAKSPTSYNKAYPDGLYAPYEDLCFDTYNGVNTNVSQMNVAQNDGYDVIRGWYLFEFLISVISFTLGSIVTLYWTSGDRVKYIELR